MKKFNKRGKFEKIIQSIIVAATVFVSSLTVFAYQEPVVVVYKNQDTSDVDFIETYEYSVSGEFDSTEYKLPNLNKNEIISYYTIDEDGTISKTNENNKKAPCNHTYKPVTHVKHMLNSAGGCTVEYYNAEKCTKCGVTIVGSKINTVTF